jgi:hypothetical protein
MTMPMKSSMLLPSGFSARFQKPSQVEHLSRSLLTAISQ